MDNKRFIIIGAQRSGTTYLYNILDEHPEICMAKPVKPEPKFFINDNYYNKGINFYDETFFSHYKNELIKGEKSTSYYEKDFASQRIKELLPDVKLLMILRNPVERAISNYFFSVDNRLETRSLDEVFIEESSIKTNNYTTSVSPFNYLGRGNYIEFIKKYNEHFEKKNLIIIIHEQFTGNELLIKKLYHELGVNTGFIPNCINQKINSLDDKKTEVGKLIKDKLKTYYTKSISELEMYLGMEIEEWK